MTLRFGTETRTDSLAQALALGFASPGVEPRYPADRTLLPTHLAIDVRLDPERRRLEGVVVVTVEATDRASTLVLDAVDLEVEGVFDADCAEVEWTYDGERIEATWVDGVLRGESRRLRVDWSVTDPIAGLVFSVPDEGEPDRPRFVATDHETERARYWLPCVDHPQVRTAVELTVHCAADLTVLGPGQRVRHTRDEHGQTSAWRLEQPCPSYLLCFAAGDFVELNLGELDGVYLAAYATKRHDVDTLQRYFGPSRRMLGFLVQHLGVPFPYPKYFQFAVPGIGGAMENISLTSWDDRFLGGPDLHAELGWLFDLINLHEMAHTWFGDAVGCKDFSHSWLKEAWATYMESVWLEQADGEEAMIWQLHEELREYRTEADGRYVRPIQTRHFDSSWDLFDRHLYPGGAVRLHMLRKQLGDAVFWRGVRRYLKAHLHGLAETADFRRALEDVSGRSLVRFFDQWLRSPGYPRLDVRLSHDRERAELKLTFQQKQVDAKKGVGLFAFDLEVDVELREGEWAQRTVRVDGPVATLVLPSRTKPRQVCLNPRVTAVVAIDFQPGTDLLKRSLTHGSTVAARAFAAAALGKAGSRRAVAALAQAAQTEPHFGVRTAIHDALAAAGSQAAVDALVERLGDEQHPRVRPRLAQVCGKHRDAGLAAALAAFAQRDDVGPVARMEALSALGKQHERADAELLLRLAEPVAGYGRVPRGALNGLGQSRQRQGAQELLGRVREGTAPPPQRAMAAVALGHAGRWQDRAFKGEALAALAERSRDPDPSVRTAVAQGVQQLGERAGAAVIESIMRSAPAQDHPRLQRGIDRLRGTGAGGQQRRLDELSEQLRRLHKRVHELQSKLEDR